MSVRKRAARPRGDKADATVRLKAPPGCGPFKRKGRRYLPSKDGVVEVPESLVEDLAAHGFVLFSEESEAAPAGEETSAKRGRKHGGR